ncbi:hypothetical protein HYH03_003200 [Edaphochlamys debaryana]|uniref:protein phosphatase methylesterase-1 n=1 Tax=Edaphochlamys debaryana TaxID=47281 RepID=A0A836C4Q4_9CHLO|nr:hypothetical protein HYH03_003200 [Edaphochlamys debaryana]|eukprot:KAG2499014.1 hypothetical protein HYH03_003200 [Edaphochlamys debaryana]
MDCFPGSRPPGGMGGSADLRRKALAVHAAGATVAPTLAPPVAGLATLGEDDESSSPKADQGPQAGSAIPAGIFEQPKPRGAFAVGNWKAYWDRREEVTLPGRGTFNVYSAGEAGPVVLCVHGGGYSGLTWSLVAKRLKDRYRVLAPDLRGHGLTTTQDDDDFSKQTMADDLVALWEALVGTPGGSASADTPSPPPAPAPAGPACSPSSAPSAPAATSAPASQASPSTPSTVAPTPAGAGTVSASPPGAPRVPAGGTAAAGPGPGSGSQPPACVLVGHSMGGGLVVWAALSKRIRRLEGVVVIDVVEGTALAALPHMMNVLAARPASFASPAEAVTWATRSGMSRCKEAAALSIPAQLREQPDGSWSWRTPLVRSRPHWEGWYEGLSEAFLQLTCPKALILAGTDRLDRSLTIGQMQGKFQLILMPTAGHAIHEDEADRTADHLLAFLRRFRVGEGPLTFPKAPAGTRPVLPVVAGPVLVPGSK